MKIKWQWFLGGQVMFWIATIFLVLFIFAYITTFMIDPTASMYMDVQNIDNTSIKELAENYIGSLGVTIDKPVYYRYVKYKHEDHFKGSSDDTVLLGSFHEWNNAYYIDISSNLYKMTRLYETIKHEVRHMLVQEMKNEKIINLTKYTEEIAQEKNEMYNNLFDYGIKLLKEKQKPIDTTDTNDDN